MHIEHLPFINLDGQLVHRNQTPLRIDNRAFRFGDGLFETIRMFNGKLPFLGKHLERLQKGMKTLEIEPIANFGIDFWGYQIQRLVKVNQAQTLADANFRVRLMIFRSRGGLYAPQDNSPRFVIELSRLPAGNFEWQTEGLKTDFYDDIRLSCDVLANLKTTSALPYVLAGIYRQKQGLDDCFLLNQYNRPAESIASNIFFVKNEVLHTPALSEGCIEGVMRSIILQIARTMNLPTEEGSYEREDLMTADEVFVCNAIVGIRWVACLSTQQFTSKYAFLIFNNLQKLVQ